MCLRFLGLAFSVVVKSRIFYRPWRSLWNNHKLISSYVVTAIRINIEGEHGIGGIYFIVVVVAAIVAGARREPDAVTAKPSPIMLQSLQRRYAVPPERTLMVGDLWSDIAFGHRAGARSALVLSGVAKQEEAKSWTGECQPDAIAADVRGLVDAAHVVRPLAPRRGTLKPALRHHAAAARGPVGLAAAGVAVAALGIAVAARLRS